MNDEKDVVTMSDLIGGGDKPRVVNPSEILPYAKETTKTAEELVMEDLDKALDALDIQASVVAKQLDEDIKVDKLDPEDEISSSTATTKEVIDDNIDIDEDSNNISIDLNDESSGELLDDEQIKQISKKYDDSMKTAVNNYKKSKMNVLDLSTFTIKEKPVAISEVLKGTKGSGKTKVCAWPLLNTGVLLLIREFTGLEIDKLDPSSNNLPNQLHAKRAFKEIYDHVENQGKPSFEEFLKIVKYTDLEDLYFAVFNSSFNKNNIFPYTCKDTACTHITIKDVETTDHIKFVSKEKEEEYHAKCASLPIVFPSSEENRIIQINNDTAISIGSPTLYNILMNFIFTEKFTSENQNLLSYATCIRNIYTIDTEDCSLSPMAFKEDVNDEAKSYKYRISKIKEFLDSLSSDELATIQSAINTIGDGEDYYSFVVPESKCEKCGKEIKEEEVTAAQLLFTRHRLTAVATL